MGKIEHFTVKNMDYLSLSDNSVAHRAIEH